MIPDIIFNFFVMFGTLTILILMYVPVILIHEIGHYLMFMFFGYRPNFRITLLGDFEIGQNIHDKINLKGTLIVSISGIVAGLLVLVIYNMFLSRELMIVYGLIYAFGIQQDIQTIMMIFKTKDWKISLYDMNKKYFYEYEKGVEKH